MAEPITREEIEKWRTAFAEMLDEDCDEPPGDFARLLAAAESSLSHPAALERARAEGAQQANALHADQHARLRDELGLGQVGDGEWTTDPLDLLRSGLETAYSTLIVLIDRVIKKAREDERAWCLSAIEEEANGWTHRMALCGIDAASRAIRSIGPVPRPSPEAGHGIDLSGADTVKATPELRRVYDAYLYNEARGAEPLTADVLRGLGWNVAVHNDYRLDGKPHTFWLFTHPDGRWAKGEGETDGAALAKVLSAIDDPPHSGRVRSTIAEAKFDPPTTPPAMTLQECAQWHEGAATRLRACIENAPPPPSPSARLHDEWAAAIRAHISATPPALAPEMRERLVKLLRRMSEMFLCDGTLKEIDALLSALSPQTDGGAK